MLIIINLGTNVTWDSFAIEFQEMSADDELMCALKSSRVTSDSRSYFQSAIYGTVFACEKQ